MAALMPYLGVERDPASQLLLQVIASILDEMMKKGEAQRRKDVNRKMTKFHGLRAPSIPVTDYLNRIAQFSGCSNEAFILMLIYIDRLVTNKEIPLDALNVHRLVITGTLLAAKFFDDYYLDNSHYSAVGGLPRHEINELELEMLFLLGFNLFVTTDNYNTYFKTLSSMAQARTIQPSPSIMPTPEQQHMIEQQYLQQQQQQIMDNDAWVCVNAPTASTPFTYHEESYSVHPQRQSGEQQVPGYQHVQTLQYAHPSIQQQQQHQWQQYPQDYMVHHQQQQYMKSGYAVPMHPGRPHVQVQQASQYHANALAAQHVQHDQLYRQQQHHHHHHQQQVVASTQPMHTVQSQRQGQSAASTNTGTNPTSAWA